jgi:glycosyltransferase involved in cell wall biosynthesis
VVIDSLSTDDTLTILRNYPNVEVIPREFDTHSDQWNFGLAQVHTEWVLALDADYTFEQSFVHEIEMLKPNQDVDAYYARFKYHVFGRPLRATLLPPRAVLFRKSRCTYFQDGHTQLLRVEGRSATLGSFIHHDDQKPLNRWLWAQDRYAALEAAKLLGTPLRELSIQDRIRRCVFIGPLVVFGYTLFAKRVLLDGTRGWYYAYQRGLLEILLSLHLMKHKIGFARPSTENASDTASKIENDNVRP